MADRAGPATEGPGVEESLLLLDLPETCPFPPANSILCLHGLQGLSPTLRMPDGSQLAGSLATPAGSTLLISGTEATGLQFLGQTRTTVSFVPSSEA
ncbi:hypothetical protein ACKKBG_A15200 [Auxenochlorella protothecoides x Auxenochlorella symbiontica]